MKGINFQNSQKMKHAYRPVYPGSIINDWEIKPWDHIAFISVNSPDSNATDNSLTCFPKTEHRNHSVNHFLDHSCSNTKSDNDKIRKLRGRCAWSHQLECQYHTQIVANSHPSCSTFKAILANGLGKPAEEDRPNTWASATKWETYEKLPATGTHQSCPANWGSLVSEIMSEIMSS